MVSWRFQDHNYDDDTRALNTNDLFDYMTDGWVAVDDVSLTGATVTKYYYLGGQRVAQRQGSVLTYLHGDHLGSASLATDASGTKITDSGTRYYPYV